MDGTTPKADGTNMQGEHIWLRYATQFTLDSRTYTIEMGIPVPLGASAETRARLIQEAEVGMDQLSQHMERRVAQTVKRGPVASSNSAPASPPRPAPATPPAPRAASQPVAQAAPPLQELPRSQEPVTAPPSRPSFSTSMPMAATGGDINMNMKLPQFIQQIREELNMTPKQAMEILKVKSLSPSTGINLWEALAHLRHIGAHGDLIDSSLDTSNTSSLPPFNTTDTRASTAHDDLNEQDTPLQDSSISYTSSLPSTRSPIPIQLHSGQRELEDEHPRTVRSEKPIYIFDEEEEDAEIDATGPQEDEDMLDDLDQQNQVSTQERVRGRTLISRLRESRAATTASAGRLNALTNVTASQINEAQFQELITGLWGITVPKKLKVDQVEALISWAKEDDFMNEIEVVLFLLEEERYARGNR